MIACETANICKYHTNSLSKAFLIFYYYYFLVRFYPIIYYDHELSVKSLQFHAPKDFKEYLREQIMYITL